METTTQELLKEGNVVSVKIIGRDLEKMLVFESKNGCVSLIKKNERGEIIEWNLPSDRLASDKNIILFDKMRGYMEIYTPTKGCGTEKYEVRKRKLDSVVLM